VITATFDIYFHLWNKGTPHWEKEKRAWEIEQEKEWTQVLSKAAKKEARKSQVPKKKVRFAECSDRPAKIHSDPVITLMFGSFETKVDPSNLKPSGSLFGRLKIIVQRAAMSICMMIRPLRHIPRRRFPGRFQIQIQVGLLVRFFGPIMVVGFRMEKNAAVDA
jgi:hypothetical protein